MRFSTHGSAAVAMAASLASATAPLPASVAERHLLDLDIPKDLSQPISANVDLGVDLSGTTLAAGVLADVSVPPVAHVGAGVEVEVVCDTCYTKGNINASISLDKVVPALSLSLTDIEAKLDLDVKIGAAATIAVNLFTPKSPISLPLPGLKVDALVSLDLILGVETAIDLSAGIDVKLVDEAKIETDIFAGKILDAAFSGLSVQVLPVEVRIGCTKLMADLRLRVELGVAAEVDIDDIIPILDLPEIGAGLEVAVFANLLEYVGFFCATPSCPLSKESYGLNVGAAVELDVAVEDLLSLHLAPTISTALLSYPTTTICQHPSYTASVPTLSATTSSASASSPATSSGAGSSSGAASGSGSVTGYPTGPAETGSASITGTSETAAATSSAPAGGVKTSTVTNTQTFTVTQCAASVPNCPAGYATTATLIKTTVYTTVCPATQTEAITAPPKPTHTKPAAPVTVTKKVVTLVPCSGASTFTPPTNVPTAPYPTGGKPAPSTATPTGAASSTYPAGSPSATQPAGSPSASSPASGPSASYPAGGPSASYPAGGPSGTAPAGSPSASYPAGGVPGSSAPAGSASASYPAGAPSSYPAVGPTGSYPVGGSSPAPYPTSVPPYPTGPAGSNGTASYSTPVTLSTYQPSASSFYPTAPSYPTGPAETPIPTAGAAKVSSGVAGALAIVGAFVALM
ncbi:hypothetical protein F5Y13DRAFT_172077 [Hypoxylon sp. FL1857]|nr:hypothetical protein F5Y13DRAFT_172077 [Hypoxylon sp. FL1857]